MRQSRLNSLFESVKATYFPRWRNGKAWVINFTNCLQRLGATGYCNTTQKVIELDQRGFEEMTPDGQIAFIIHEICHEVGGALHQKPWVKRMAKASWKADSIGSSEVASILRSDIGSYSLSDVDPVWMRELFGLDPDICLVDYLMPRDY